MHDRKPNKRIVIMTSVFVMALACVSCAGGYAILQLLEKSLEGQQAAATIVVIVMTLLIAASVLRKPRK